MKKKALVIFFLLFLMCFAVSVYASVDTVKIHGETKNVCIHRDGGITNNIIPEITVLLQNKNDNSIGYLNQFPVEEDGRIDVKFKFEGNLDDYCLMIRDTDGDAVPFSNIQVTTEEKTSISLNLELDNKGIFIAEDEKAYAKASIANIYGDSEPYLLILAMYDSNNNLIDVKTSEQKSLSYDGAVYEDVFSAPVALNTRTVKAFCISDVKRMIPYDEASRWVFEGFVTLPNLISDHMLVQADEPIKIWGSTSAANGEVNAYLTDEAGEIKSSGSTVSSADGSFKLEMSPLKAGNTTYTLKVSADGAEKIVEDVLVGELWLLGGQSNMAMMVKELHSDYSSVILPKEKINQIRYFRRTSSTVSEDKLGKDLNGFWAVADGTSVKNFSAIGWCALKELYDQLNVPVGGLYGAFGGTQMYQWAAPQNRLELAEGDYFKRMVKPFTQFNLKGVFWYQGESDTRKLTFDNYYTFTDLFENLITGWRGAFNDSDMPFIFFQLALWNDRDVVPGMLAQLDTYHMVENTGMASAIDCPPDSDYDLTANGGLGMVHPTNKEKVGKRLAYNALSMLYGKNIPSTGPLYLSESVSGNTMTVTFSATEGGLKTTDGKAPEYFEIAGADGVYYKADAKIGEDKKTVKLSAPEVSEPVYARYFCLYDSTWSNNFPVGNLVSESGLPVSPFITNPKVTPKEH